MALFEEIDSREKGAVPVSIGTSLALESADGHYPERPVVEPAPLLSVELVMVNMRTIFRNLVGAIDREVVSRIRPADLIAPFVEELRIIQSFVKERSNGQCQVLYYLSKYQHVNHTTFKGAVFKEAVTLKQKVDTTREFDFFELLEKTELDIPARMFDGPIEGKYGKTFIVTHHPVDLLQRKLFAKLELLESHTGAIKPRGLWGTKLKGQNHEHIPLNAFTLKVFGDGIQFVGLRNKLRKLVEDVALLDHWSGLSTDALIANSVSKILPQVDRDFLKTLL